LPLSARLSAVLAAVEDPAWKATTAWQSAWLLACDRLIGHAAGTGRSWRRQYPGHHGPKYQPRGTVWQLSPAHHGRARKRADHAVLIAIRAAPLWVLPPDTGLGHESGTCDPRACPGGHAEPVAWPPAAKPGEPGDKHRERESQPCPFGNGYDVLHGHGICAQPFDPGPAGHVSPAER